MSGCDGVGGMCGCEGVGGMCGCDGVGGACGCDGLGGMSGCDGVGGMYGCDGMGGACGCDGVGGMSGCDGVGGACGCDGVGGMSGCDGVGGARGCDGVGGACGCDGVGGACGCDGVGGACGSGGVRRSWGSDDPAAHELAPEEWSSAPAGALEEGGASEAPPSDCLRLRGRLGSRGRRRNAAVACSFCVMVSSLPACRWTHFVGVLRLDPFNTSLWGTKVGLSATYSSACSVCFKKSLVSFITASSTVAIQSLMMLLPMQWMMMLAPLTWAGEGLRNRAVRAAGAGAGRGAVRQQHDPRDTGHPVIAHHCPNQC